jgi:hypothetical protein
MQNKPTKNRKEKEISKRIEKNISPYLIVNKMWSIYTMEYYSAIKRSTVLIHDIHGWAGEPWKLC